MQWMLDRRDPMKFVEAAEKIAHSRSKSMIGTSVSYQKDSGGSKAAAAVTSHVGVMAPEMHKLFKTFWESNKTKTTNIVTGGPKKKIVKPVQRKGTAKKCAQADV